MIKTDGLIGKNVTVGSKRTSIRLEPVMWDALREIARRENVSVHRLCTEVSYRKSPQMTLTAAVRVFLMSYFYHAATEEGHNLACHGSMVRQEIEGLSAEKLKNIINKVS